MLEIYRALQDILATGGKAVLATVISAHGSVPRKAGAKMLIKEDGSFIGTVGGGGVEKQTTAKAMEVIRSGEPQLLHLDLSGKGGNAGMICGGQMDVFLEPVLPREKLFFFGAGHISQSTAAMSVMLGFGVTVIDPRAEYNNTERFPGAESLIVEDYAVAFQKLNIDETSYIVIYTTGHVSDEQCLEFAVGTSAKYIGMIGSKKKVKEVKERLRQKGISAERLSQVHAPIGLEIGAETPPEIAVSILAEIIKVLRGDDVGRKS